MTLRIERSSDGPRTIFCVSGRIGSDNLEELKSEITSGQGTQVVLDLEHVTLVDVDGVRFLSACEANGIEVTRCSHYIREWMVREHGR